MVNTRNDIYAPLETTLLKKQESLDATDRPHVDMILRHTRELLGDREIRSPRDMLRMSGVVKDMDAMRAVSPIIRTTLERKLNELMLALLPRFPVVKQEISRITAPEVLGIDVKRGRTKDEREAQQMQLEKTAMEIVSLVAAAGIPEEEVLSALHAMGNINDEQRVQLRGVVARALGKMRRVEGGGGHSTLLATDPELLTQPSIRQYAIPVLQRAVYTHLKEQNVDTIQARDRLLKRVDKEAMSVLEKLAKESKVHLGRHEQLVTDIVRYFERLRDVALTEIPEMGCFIDRITDYSGNIHPFPSLRQLMGVQHLLDQLKKYICFEPGLGKTAVPYLLWAIRQHRRRKENQPEEKFIGITPKKIVHEAAWSVRHPAVYDGNRELLPTQYFKENARPTVGIIESGITAEDFTEALQQQMIFVSPTMWNSSRDEAAVIDRLLTIKPRVTWVDEMDQIANGGKKWSQEVRKLFLESNVRVATSGTPTGSGGIEGLAVALETLEDPNDEVISIDSAREAGMAYKTEITWNIAQMRARIARLLFVVDAPQQTEDLSFQPYPVTEDQRDLIRMWRQDRTLTFKEKEIRNILVLRCPWLFLGEGAECPLLNELCTWIQSQLQSKRSFMVVENWLSKGLMVPDMDFPGRTFAEVFEQRIKAIDPRIQFHSIHGEDGCSDRERKEIFDQLRNAQNANEFHVAYVKSSCMDAGIDLRGIGGTRRTGPAYRYSKIRQEAARSNRAGYQAPFHVHHGLGSDLETAMRQISLIRDEEERNLLYAGGVNMRRLDTMYQQTSDDQLQDESAYRRALEERDVQRLQRYEQQMHGAGAKSATRFWGKHKNDWERFALENVDVSGAGDRQRATAALYRTLQERGIVKDGPLVHINGKGGTLARQLLRDGKAMPEMISVDGADWMHLKVLERMLKDGQSANIRSVMATSPQVDSLITNTILPEYKAGAVILDDLAQCKWRPDGTDSYKRQERAQAFLGAVRLAAIEAPVILTESFEACTEKQFKQLWKETFGGFGIMPVKEFCGLLTSTDNSGDPAFKMHVAVGTRFDNPTWKEALFYLENGGNLDMTHMSQWPEAKQRALENDQRKRRFPGSLMHREYSLNGQSFAMEKMPENYNGQRSYMEKIAEAVKAIHKMAPNPLAWQNPTERLRDQLRDMGIMFLGGARPSFVLTKKKTTFRLPFYPYDQAWEK